MAKNRENKPKKASNKKMKAQLTSMDEKSNQSRNSVTGYVEQQPNSHFNQMK